MGENHSFLALDWVKGEIEETLKQARQALESHVENPEDATRMRFCLAYLHQVYGTLHMVEFYGAALLAEEMEKLCLALINGKVGRIDDGQEVLMRAILQLPPYLERVKASRRDLPVVLLPLLNDLRAVRGEPLMSETALFTPDLAAGERAPIQLSAQAADPALIKKIRQMYQVALLGLIRQDKVEQNLAYMDQVFARLEKIAGPSPMRELWLVSGATVEGLVHKSIDAGTSIKMLMGHVDRQLRKLGDDADQRPPTELMKNLLYYIAKSSGQTPKLRAVKDLYRLDDALPTDALVNEERARMAGPDREAMKSVVDALGEELARVKDALDIFVRAAQPNIADLGTLVPTLKQVADTVAVLGLGQPRRILQEQIEVIDGITAANELPKDGRLLDVAGALLYVEATLNGMVADKPAGAGGGEPDMTDLSGQKQLSDAHAAVLRESRGALERSKDAVIEFIASQWNPVHLEPIPELIGTVRGGLTILNMPRPADLLARAGQYISERLLKEQHRPDWPEMDTLADIITSVEYYLERVANDSQGGESVLDIAEAGLGRLGYGEDESAKKIEGASGAHEPDHGEWDDEAADALEAELTASEPLSAELPPETKVEEVLQGASDFSLDDLALEEPASDFAASQAHTAVRLDTLELEPLAPAAHKEPLAPAHEDIQLEDLHFDSAELEALEADAAPSHETAAPLADAGLDFDALIAPEHEPHISMEPVEARAHQAPLDEPSLDFSLDDLAALEITPEETINLGHAEPVHAEPPSHELDAGLDLDAFELEPVAELLPEPVAPAIIEPVAPVAPVAAAPVAAEPPKKPVLPVLSQMPEDDHSFDEEIREIFVEEAQEVLEMIDEHFPAWAANFENRSALVEFRRGFHTLKGSGRMVGAKALGELAWAIENMLNKVRDNILEPNQAMVNLISEVLAVVPGLVEDFQNRQTPRINTSALMAVADSLSRGEALSTVDIAAAAEQAHGAAAPAAAEAEAELEFADADFDALAASLAPKAEVVAEPAPTPVVVEPAPVVEPTPEADLVAELPQDAFHVELENLDQLQAEPDLDAELAALDLDTEATPTTADVDPVLLEIFTSEADSHLSEIQLYLDLIDKNRPNITITDQVLRSLHTLKGSAGMAGIAAVADIAAPMEHLFKDLRNQGAPAKRQHLEALQAAHDLIQTSIKDLIAGGSGRAVGSEALIAHIHQLDHERLADLEKSEAERLDLDMPDAAQESSETLMAATAGRVASFMALGLDHVLDAPWELDGWLNGIDREGKLLVLREELLRLAPAARRADLEPLALVAERLASIYSRISEHTLALNNELLNDLAGAHDEIINIFDTLAASQTVQANDAVLERLLDWLEAPVSAVEPALDDEPFAVSFEVEEKPSLAEIVVDGVEDNSAPQGLAEHIDEDLDPELLEIFLEEAEEVLEAADGELSAWRANPDNKGPLAALQRQLHTLKGGARLAEIKSLGDLAHELEFLYEGLTDGRYPASPDLVDLLQRCHDRLADMVSDLRGNGRCMPATDLVNAINNYRRNPGAGVSIPSAVPELAAAAPASVHQHEHGSSFAAAPHAEVLSFAAEEHALESELEVKALDADDPFKQLEADINALVHGETLGHDVAETPAAGTVVDELPASEDTEALFAEFFPDAVPHSPAANDVAPVVAEAPAEEISLEHPQALLNEVVPAPVEPEAAPEPVLQAASVVEAFVAPVVAAPVAAVSTNIFADVDPELLEIFLEEAGEIVDATSEQLSHWLEDTNNTLPVQQLQRGLHTLKGGARMAEITPLGDLAHQMEDLYEGLCDGVYTVTPGLFQLLHRCHDRLAEAVESLRQGQGCASTDDLTAQIKRYIADPHHYQDVPVAVSLTPHVPEPEPQPEAVVEPVVAAPVEPEPPKAPPAPKAIEAAEVPEQVDADILEIFFEESDELTEGIESSINDWLENHDNPEPLEALMRHLHTLKGGARLAGLKELGDLAHHFETDLVAIQMGNRPADQAFFNGLGARLDEILAAVKTVKDKAHGVSDVAAPVVAEAPAVVEPLAQPEALAEPAALPVEVPQHEVTHSPELAAPVVVQPLVAAPAVISAPAAAVPSVGPRVAPPPMAGGFKNLQANRGPQEMIRVPSDLLEKLVNLAGETSITRSRVEMGVHGFAQTVEEMGATIQRLADQLRRMDSEMETQIISRHNDEKEGAAKYEEFDPLEMDQYSSLNQLSKALAESASDLLDLKSTLIDKTRDTETLLLQQSRINTELQEGLMRSRMVPFSRLVPRLKRIVRQTGQEVGKPADLDVINAEGEMDRTLLERVVAPLEHMLRNAVDHGIEKPEGRAAAGKPAQGKVTLSLAREGGEVVLTLADDGAGINIAAVRKKAIERGLIPANAEISDQEVIQFIFHAGFSTAEKVTQISGRGVGMDVVQSEIKQMGGVVSIGSEVGQGTTFTIRLPFTVAVNRALMVRIGEDVYAIPLSQIEGIVRASPYELEAYYAPGAPLFEYAGIAYRLNYLGEFVHGVKSPNLLGHTLPLPVLLVRGGEQRVAIQVDQLIGSREIVVKSVGMQLSTVAGISGATILGDGSVVIILDVVAMLRAAAITTPRLGAAGAAPGLPVPEVARARTVMVVDDSVTVRKVTSRLLERHGYEVLLAKDGMDAIAKLEDQKPDLMLLDIEMPRMDGFEVASLVRHNPNLEDLPIIMITSRTGEKHRERAFQIGVNCYMGKPFQEEQLLETIAELLAATVR